MNTCQNPGAGSFSRDSVEIFQIYVLPGCRVCHIPGETGTNAAHSTNTKTSTGASSGFSSHAPSHRQRKAPVCAHTCTQVPCNSTENQQYKKWGFTHYAVALPHIFYCIPRRESSSFRSAHHQTQRLPWIKPSAESSAAAASYSVTSVRAYLPGRPNRSRHKQTCHKTALQIRRPVRLEVQILLVRAVSRVNSQSSRGPLRTY